MRSSRNGIDGAAALLLAVGAALRLAYAWHMSVDGAAFAEAYHVAVAFARTGQIADAFTAGSGPTAHLSPVMPGAAGLVYRTFGVRSLASEMILAFFSIGCCIASFALLFAAFGRLGMARRSRLLGLAGCCLLPLYQPMEAGIFRIWESALAALLGTACLFVVVRTERSARGWTLATIVPMALLGAATLFVIPVLGVAAFLIAGISLLRRRQFRAIPVAVLASLLALAAVIGPWAARNARVMGSPVLLRDNFGLETALAFYPGALRAPDPDRSFQARYDSIHPEDNPAVLRRMRDAGGEVAYSKGLLVGTKTWIAAHPGEAALLAGRHVVQYLFPPYWIVAKAYNGGAAVRLAAQALSWLLDLLMIAALVAAAWRRRAAMLYPAIFVLLPVVQYALTQPIMRYRYLIFGISVFLAADLLCGLAERIGRLSGPERRAADKRAAALRAVP